VGPGEHLTVISRATVYHAPSRTRLGYGEGICTTRERKHAYRRADRACPECGQPTVLKSKDARGGWFCWRKRGGRGPQFPDGDERIERQAQGEIENLDLPDAWNTADKMAKKRAYVDAALSVTGASAIFSQDIGADPTVTQGRSGERGVGCRGASAHERRYGRAVRPYRQALASSSRSGTQRRGTGYRRSSRLLGRHSTSRSPHRCR
jgi:hypothetical protein